MNKIVFLVFSAVFLMAAQVQAQTSIKKSNTEKIMGKQTIYQFKVQDLSGDTFDFSSLKGKKS